MKLENEKVPTKTMKEGAHEHNKKKKSEKAAKRIRETMAAREAKIESYLVPDDDPSDPNNGGSQFVPSGSGSHRRRLRVKLIVNQLKSKHMNERKIRAGLLMDFTERKTDEYIRTAKEIIKMGC